MAMKLNSIERNPEMIPDDTTSLTGKLPFHVPCPPPALRLPPPVYRMTSAVIRTTSKPIPSPPLGARVPGDRVVRSPVVFLAPAILKESFTSQECDHPERTLENDLTLILSSDGLAVDISDLIQEEKQSLEDNEQLPESVLVPASAAEMTEKDWYVPYETQGHTDKLIEKTEEPNLAKGSTMGDIMEGSSPLRRIDDVPEEILPCIEIPFEGDSICITELTDLLGVKSYEILRDLISLGIFVKMCDSITMDTANKISGRYGISIVCEKTVAVMANPADVEDVAKSNFPNSSTFELKSNLKVTVGDWIRDSVLGLGRILKLYTHREVSDAHRVWFVGQSEEGTIIEHHPLLSGTLGVIDKSMVPKDIFNAAPKIDMEIS